MLDLVLGAGDTEGGTVLVSGAYGLDGRLAAKALPLRKRGGMGFKGEVRMCLWPYTVDLAGL